MPYQAQASFPYLTICLNMLLVTISSLLVILPYNFSPSILFRHHLMNVCSLLVIALLVLYVSYPYSSNDLTVELNILIFGSIINLF